jgi:glucose/arabinose dehydrogenase
MDRRHFQPSVSSLFATLEPRQLLASLSPGLSINSLVSNFGNPTTFVSDYQSTLFVGDLDGTIQAVSTINGQKQILGRLPAENVDARGLYGLVLDPDFSQNHFMYAFYYALSASGGREARISQLVLSHSHDWASSEPALNENVLMRIPITNAPRMHHGGALEIDRNGYLFFAIGDLEEPRKIAQLDKPNGKLFRIGTDGTIPSDNPFYKRSKGLGRAVWATGLREPMSSSYNPVTDQLLVNDVGHYQREEINLIKKGANYGWPNFEATYFGSIRGGNIKTTTMPIYSYMNMSAMTVKTKPTTTTKTFKSPIATNNDMGCAILGGSFYSPTGTIDKALAEYMGDYLFVDLCAGWVSALDFQKKSVTHLADDLPFQLLDVAYTNDGRIYLLTYGDTPADKSIQVIEPQTQAPPAFISAGGNVLLPMGESTTLAPVTSGPGPVVYQWFHNGQELSGKVSATLLIPSQPDQSVAGDYFVRATNSFGQTDSPVWKVATTTRTRPKITMTVSNDGQSVKAGNIITFSARATDDSDGSLAASQFQWQVELRHNTHGHPLLALANTASGQFKVGDYSYEKGDLFIQLTLTVTNSIGLTQTARKTWPVVF